MRIRQSQYIEQPGEASSDDSVIPNTPVTEDSTETEASRVAEPTDVLALDVPVVRFSVVADARRDAAVLVAILTGVDAGCAVGRAGSLGAFLAWWSLNSAVDWRRSSAAWTPWKRGRREGKFVRSQVPLPSADCAGDSAFALMS